MQVLLKITNLSKVYTDQVGYRIHLLENVSAEIKENEFISFLAPSGSGKTSLLKILAGLEDPTSGQVENFKNKIIFIPTKPSSFTWLNVYENISFESSKNLEEIKNIINLVGLSGYEDHYPDNKSEGFRFRISLGRALAHNPKIVLIDEPFNNLNHVTRQEIYLMLRDIFIKTGITFVLGTTNITEAVFLSEKIYLMKKNPGEIIDDILINLPKEREIKIIDNASFIKLRDEVEQKLKERLNRLLYNFSI